MIAHLVAFAPDPNRPDDLAAVMAGLSGLIGQIDGFVAFTHGPNIDLERKSQGYPYGFVCTFADRAALERYAADPRHQALGGRLVALCKDGVDGITVFDIEERAPK